MFSQTLEVDRVRIIRESSSNDNNVLSNKIVLQVAK